MRIPTSKIYRAFACLDEFTDTQCEMLMRRVRISPARTAGLWLVPLGSILIGCLISGALVESTPFFRPSHGDHRYLKPLLTLVTFFSLPLLSALIVRDLLLRQFLVDAIRIRLRRVRCGRCKYLLIGRTPHEGQVTCPECGLDQSLESLGAEPADLLATSDTQLASTAEDAAG